MHTRHVMRLLSCVVLMALGTFTEERAVSAHEEASLRVRWNFQVEDGPGPIVVDDFNSDGLPDLARANANATVSILLGQRNGTFKAAGDMQVEAVPTALTADDVNDDGKPDLILTNANATMSILLGLGDGTFEAAGDVPVRAIPTPLTMDDVNDDNQPAPATARSAVDPVIIPRLILPPVLDDFFVNFNRMSSTYKLIHNDKGCPAGQFENIFQFRATLTLRPTIRRLTQLAIEVVDLSGGAFLQRTRGNVGTEGALLAGLRQGDYADGKLERTRTRQEKLSVLFKVCLREGTQFFTLAVDVHGKVR